MTTLTREGHDLTAFWDLLTAAKQAAPAMNAYILECANARASSPCLTAMLALRDAIKKAEPMTSQGWDGQII